MSQDYIPQSPENLHPWADNLHSEIALQASDLGMAPADVTNFQSLIAPIRDQAADVLQKQDDLDTVTGQLRTYIELNLPALRKSINNIKTLPGYNPGIGTALKILTTGSGELDPATYKPELAAAVFQGYVRLSGKKLGADALNLYTRLQGQTTWNLLAAKRVRFPFDDEAPLHIPGTPEIREYRAIGVVTDHEVGLPSDIVTATFAG